MPVLSSVFIRHQNLIMRFSGDPTMFLFLFGTALMAAWGPHFQAGLGHICDVGANNKK